MSENRWLPCLALLLTLAACTSRAPRPDPRPGPVVKYGVPVTGGPMDQLLLKDYRPAVSLVVPRTGVPRAAFPVIDVHTHAWMSHIGSPADVAAWVRTMDEVGVEKSVVFTEATGAEFDRLARLFLSAYPTRFQVYCGIDVSAIDAPDYAARAAAELVRCYNHGARGVGELTDKGWGLQASEKDARPRPQRLRLDDPRLDAFWNKCAELHIPANVHIADHPSCWQPLGPTQERTPDFQSFNLYGKDVPSYEELLASRDRVLARHRGTTFIFCHLSNQGNDMASLALALDRHPNMYLDISARDYEIGRQPRTARAFLERYRGRVMFGTDMGRDKGMYQAWWRLLESGDEFIPGRIWWTYYGLKLPAPVLRSLYRETARKVLSRGD